MADEQSDRVRVRMNYRGRVQGVGFRFTALEISRGFDISGVVRNLPDGTVELEAEGAPATVEAFLEKIAVTMASNIRGQERQVISPRQQEQDRPAFDIRL